MDFSSTSNKRDRYIQNDFSTKDLKTPENLLNITNLFIYYLNLYTLRNVITFV